MVLKCSTCYQLALAFHGCALFVKEMIHPFFFHWACLGRKKHLCICLGGLVLLESHGASSPWWKRLYIATALALNRSASPIKKRANAPQNTRGSRQSLYGDPILCATLFTADGAGELYLRRSSFFLLETSAPMRIGDVRCADHPPMRIGDERERLFATPPVMTKNRGPSWGGGGNNPEKAS
jgi:hypothetical protein